MRYSGTHLLPTEYSKYPRRTPGHITYNEHISQGTYKANITVYIRWTITANSTIMISLTGEFQERLRTFTIQSDCESQLDAAQTRHGIALPTQPRKFYQTRRELLHSRPPYSCLVSLTFQQHLLCKLRLHVQLIAACRLNWLHYLHYSRRPYNSTTR